MYIVLVALLFALLMLICFVAGAYFCSRTMEIAQRQAREDALHYAYYHMAGVMSPTDPMPYVPPVTPRARTFMQGMSKLDRLLKQGKRGTIMVRAGDRNKSAV